MDHLIRNKDYRTMQNMGIRLSNVLDNDEYERAMLAARDSTPNFTDDEPQPIPMVRTVLHSELGPDNT